MIKSKFCLRDDIFLQSKEKNPNHHRHWKLAFNFGMENQQALFDAQINPRDEE